MEGGVRSFSRGDWRSRRSTGEREAGGEGGRHGIFWVRGRDEHAGGRFWPPLKSASSKVAGSGSRKLRCSGGEGAPRTRRKETPMAVGFDVQSSGKRHVYRSSVTMADELLQQAQELLEGQIVGRCPASRLSSELTACPGFRRPKANRAHFQRPSSCLRCMSLRFALFSSCAGTDINLL